MESRWIPTELKVATIDRLARAGVREIEAVSFVHPKVVPQMADAAEVMARIERHPGVCYLALVPNLKGAERALAAGVDAIRQVVCVTDTYNRRNIGLSVEQSAAEFGRVADLAGAAGVPASVVLGATYGCPFEGRVSDGRILQVAERFAALGSVELGLADSAGLAHPLQIRRVIRRLREHLPETKFWLHLHDTRGFGLANAYAAMQEGIDRFDTSLGGLGGCPVVRGATGNIATEDLVYLCREMGIETGVDLDQVRQASRRLQDFLERPLASRVLRAGTLEELVASQRRKTAG
jgi:hydroxymethylglutaryl-CoA lyase